MRSFLSFLFTLGIAVQALAAAAPTSEDLEFFEKQVRPILVENCFSCHSTHARIVFANLRLDTRQAVLKGSDTGPVVLPGNSTQSLLLKAVRGQTAKRMPPGKALNDAQIAALTSWVDRGLPWPSEAAAPPTAAPLAFDLQKRRREHWAWQPVQPVSLPAVQNKAWPLEPVDPFILARLEQRGVAPAQPADRTTWLRRVTFDLTGLPPTPAEIQAFTTDQSADVYEKVVDRLLESPRFGERWARRWMDLMRYTESHGSEGDPAIPFAWRYRDYLVRAFNAGVPYDQLIREHLAGDLLPSPRVNPAEHLNESVLALAQFRMVEHGFQPVDPWEDRVKWTDNQIDVFSKTFQGLTVSCARCHDHKFDAISQRDYYALFGIFANARPTQVATDEAAVLNKNRAELTGAKPAIKSAVAKVWETAAEKAAARLLQDNPWFTLRNESFRSDFHAASSFYSNELPARRDFNSKNFPRQFNLSEPGWVTQGINTSSTPSTAGEIGIEPEGGRVLTGVLPRGAYTHLLTPKHSGIITSPRFKIDTDYISMKVAGANGAAVRLIVENYAVPRGGIYNQITPVNDSKPHWIRWNTNFWKGFTAYIEFATADLLTVPPGKEAKEGRSWVGVQQVLFHDKELTPKDDLPAVAALLAGDPPATAEAFQARLATTIREAIQAWSDNRTTDTQAALLDYLTRQNLLPVSLDALPDVRPLVDRYRKLEQEIPLPRRAPGILEEGGEDQSILIRGNISRRGAPVPRRYLEALDSQPYQDRRSMRLQLANEVASPANPLTARVMANRVWYTLFRRGIVRTVDNFGKLGDKPSHPELLDYLAARFVADGWSIKKLTRMLALSQTYRLSGGDTEPEPLWQHMPTRRLEAEELRDTMLAVSGQLDTKMYGASVPVYYSHETGKTKDDRPKGPLNGNGRRSVYLEIRRNATDPLLEVFDFPKPSTTRGERDVTNVPAQSLALMNSPFVIEQAGKWAQQKEEVETMFLRAVGRQATPAESDDMKSYLAGTSRRDLAHALFNLKEFLYVR